MTRTIYTLMRFSWLISSMYFCYCCCCWINLFIALVFDRPDKMWVCVMISIGLVGQLFVWPSRHVKRFSPAIFFRNCKKCKWDEWQTIHGNAILWTLHIHFTFRNFDHISRSQQCQKNLIVTFKLNGVMRWSWTSYVNYIS